MNVYDSERMTDIMLPLGYKAVDSYEDADLVILNTCHIREKAAEKVYSDLGRIRKYQNQKARHTLDSLTVKPFCKLKNKAKEINTSKEKANKKLN